MITSTTEKDDKMQNQFTENQEVWVHLPWVDADCWELGTFIKETAKRYKVSISRGEIYTLKKYIKAA